MLKYMFRKKTLFIMYMLLVPAMAITSVLFSISLQPLFDSANFDSANQVITALLTSLGLAILDMVIAGIHKNTRERLRVEFVTGLRNDLFCGIFNQKVAEFGANNSAYYINVLSQDVGRINAGYFDSICGIYRVITAFVITFGTLVFLNPYIAIINLVLSIISVAVPKLMENKLNKRKMAASEAGEKYLQNIKEALTGFTTIKLFHVFDYILEKVDISNKNEEICSYKSIQVNYWSAWISMLCSTISYVLTIGIGVWLVLQGQMTSGAVLAISQLIGGIVAPFEELPVYLVELSSIKELKCKIMKIINCSQMEEQVNQVSIDESGIKLKDVVFSYDETKTQINHVDVCFQKGKKYAVISSFSENQLYSLVNFIEQDVFLFQDTFWNNISLYRPYSQKEMESAIRQAGLKDVVENLQDGWDTMLDENGNNFSGGEKQRIGLARALLTGTNYLILDEVTSNLDAVLESEIEHTVMELQNVSAIIITHRLNEKLLRKCDAIIAMKDGEIVEQGTFDELMNKCGYFYGFFMVNKQNDTNDIDSKLQGRTF